MRLESITKNSWGRSLRRGRLVARFAPPLALLALMGVIPGLPVRGEPKRYDPDRETCQVDTIRRAYRANLLPWEDQPAVVQERLRQLQAANTLDTLRECQEKGLLRPDQVTSLTTELELRPSPVSAPSSSSPTRP